MTKEEKPMPSFYAIVPAEARYSDMPYAQSCFMQRSRSEGLVSVTKTPFFRTYGRTDRTIRRWINILKKTAS